MQRSVSCDTSLETRKKLALKVFESFLFGNSFKLAFFFSAGFRTYGGLRWRYSRLFSSHVRFESVPFDVALRYKSASKTCRNFFAVGRKIAVNYFERIAGIYQPTGRFKRLAVGQRDVRSFRFTGGYFIQTCQPSRQARFLLNEKVIRMRPITFFVQGAAVGVPLSVEEAKSFMVDDVLPTLSQLAVAYARARGDSQAHL